MDDKTNLTCKVCHRVSNMLQRPEVETTYRVASNWKVNNFFKYNDISAIWRVLNALVLFACSSRVRVTRSIVLYVCFVNLCPFVFFCFGHYIVCPSIYGFSLLLWYRQTLHSFKGEYHPWIIYLVMEYIIWISNKKGKEWE